MKALARFFRGLVQNSNENLSAPASVLFDRLQRLGDESFQGDHLWYFKDTITMLEK